MLVGKSSIFSYNITENSPAFLTHNSAFIAPNGTGTNLVQGHVVWS